MKPLCSKCIQQSGFVFFSGIIHAPYKLVEIKDAFKEADYRLVG